MKKSKTLRVLEHMASKGDVKAQYKLYEDYRDGFGVEKDEKVAREYYDKVISKFSKNRLSISKLKLTDYRFFDDLEINFPRCYGRNSSRLTVIVGNNGAGKTSILEAISSGLNFISRRISNLKANAHNLMDNLDVKVNSYSGVADIFIKFEVLKGVDFDLSLSKTAPLSTSKKKSELSDVGQLSDIYRGYHLSNNMNSLPIMAFYSVKRSNEVVKKDIGFDERELDQYGFNILDGYKDAFDGYAGFKLIFSWLKRMDDIANADEKLHSELVANISRIRSELDSDLVKDMERDSVGNEILKKHYDALVYEKKGELAVYETKLRELDGSPERKLINYVVDAILVFMDDFEHLRIQRKPKLDLLVDKNGLTISVLQLSQGEKSLMALVADIARRLVLLNPSLPNPLLGSGVVLIDEIDLHLHPSWQQTVIPKLLHTFENIQFIITTHSPQVLSTVESESVRILDNGNIHKAPSGCKGAESSRLLDRIFNVSPRPLGDEVVKVLNEYKQCVYDSEYDSDKALKLRMYLDEKFGSEDPDLMKLDLYIENLKWERDIEKDL